MIENELDAEKLEKSNERDLYTADFQRRYNITLDSLVIAEGKNAEKFEGNYAPAAGAPKKRPIRTRPARVVSESERVPSV